jgi:hypothetical protein
MEVDTTRGAMSVFFSSFVFVELRMWQQIPKFIIAINYRMGDQSLVCFLEKK